MGKPDDNATLLNHLIGRNEQLDRELEAALKRAKISPRTFENLDQRIARLNPKLIAQARDRLERELASIPKPPDITNRPSFAALASRFRGRLVRA